MKKRICCIVGMMCLLFGVVSTAFALEEKDTTVIYKVTTHSKAGDLINYVAYSIVAQDKADYWLQRTTSNEPDSQPLSITQTLIDSKTHKPLQYIMYRPERMNRPANVADFPLTEMGKDEILPLPITSEFADAGHIQVPAGDYAVKQAQVGPATRWVSPDVPVLGVVKAEAPDWTMELFRIDSKAADLLPQKPQKGGVVYLKTE
jgi:hypothetical protein